EFSAMVRKDFPDMPLLIQSSDRTNKIDAKKLGAGFLDKRSPTLAQDFRKILNEVFYFGDYRVTNGKNPNVYKIKSLSSLVDTFTELPADVVVENIRNGQLCRWLRARTDIKLANGLSELNTVGADIETTKIQIIELIKKYRKWNHRGSITAYSPKYFKDYSNFSKIGGGSIGGKARGLAFIDKSLAAYFNVNKYPGINVSIPATLVLATDLFDSFINDNDLLEFAAKPDLTNQQVVDRFIQYNLPEETLEPIREFIQQIKVPLAVRSSSVLEDSLYQPFAGIYATIMLPNDHPDEDVRYNNLLYAVKCLYASTYFREPKSYIKNTNYHIEDEKMAVVIQEVVGKRRGDRFYPDFSGVARSYNYYPFGGSKAEEGVVSLATGLGKIIVDGGQSITYSPANPMVLPQYNTVDDYLKNSQHEMWAIQMGLDEFIDINNEEQYLTKVDLKTAEEDGVLLYTGSTYIPENHQIYDGISRYGPRVITFAHILKNNVFPLNDLIKDLLKIGEHAVGAPVEIEFSVTLGSDSPYPANFGFLQVRPCTGKGELIEVQFDRFTEASVFCQSDQILGNGEITDIKDILFVKPDKFDPAKTPLIANEIGEFNKKLKKKLSPYLLAGPGRWGSSESWLGIPVQWDQIDNAKVMIETSHSKMSPDPSQGSHFFHNITSLRIGYFTIPPKSKTSMIDWDWLRRQPFVEETDYVRHVRFDSGFMIKMDGRTGKGVILKPGIMGVMSRMFPI
ncbi:MAG: histidine kinase, partial [Acidobacteria bacterium]|nr:histidine kinase [Acidobacteriota bacterium]